MSKRILLVNGPKSSGKDYATNQIHEIFELVEKAKFAKPMYDGLQNLFGIDPDEWEHIYNNHKEEPSDLLFGMTPRNAMIWMSEEVMKPKFGKDVCGIIASNRVRSAFENGYELVVFSDSGFADEAKVIVRDYGAENVYLLQIHSEGCNFNGDSRSYVYPEDIGIPEENFEVVKNTKDVRFNPKLVAALKRLGIE